MLWFPVFADVGAESSVLHTGQGKAASNRVLYHHLVCHAYSKGSV